MNILRRLSRCKLNPSWYKYAVGGKWDEIGKLQFDFMVAQGLKPEHYLLDIGCGSLRGGLHFIRYLEQGRYWGIDNNQELLNIGRRLIWENGFTYKRPFLTCLQNFEFPSNGYIKVNFALAQSLFTHLTREQIKTCIENVIPILNSTGKFFATFFENEEAKMGEPQKIINYDTYAYPFWMFQRICAETGINVKRVKDFKHPRGQKMMVITIKET